MSPPVETRGRTPTGLPAYGSDRAEPGPNGSRILFCDLAKGWRPHTPGTSTSAEHPGTAVRWDGEIFEVVEDSATPDGGTRYRLEPWNPRHAIRVAAAYDAESETARAIGRKARGNAVQFRRWSILLSPLAGHLPGPMQEKMESEFGAPARWMTIVSALPFLVMGAFGALSKMATNFGGAPSFPAGLTPPLPLALYWFAESMLRLAVAFLQGIPMGSLAGVLGYELWRGSSGRDAPSIAAPAAAAPAWAPGDTYKMREPLLALLSPAEQEGLERRFGFDVRKWGRASAILVGLVAGLNVVIALGMMAQGRDTVWDAIWLVAGGYLCAEQAVRLHRIAGGRPAGSALAAVVRPMARRLLAPSSSGGQDNSGA